MIKGIDHVAVAVSDLDETIETFKKVFGVDVAHREVIEGYNVETATFDLGNTCIEFIQGTTDESPIRRYVEKKGPGIHHVALAVDDVAAAITTLSAGGAEMIDRIPRKGKGGSLVAFVHPGSTGKILYELVQAGPADGKEVP